MPLLWYSVAPHSALGVITLKGWGTNMEHDPWTSTAAVKRHDGYSLITDCNSACGSHVKWSLTAEGISCTNIWQIDMGMDLKLRLWFQFSFQLIVLHQAFWSASVSYMGKIFIHTSKALGDFWMWEVGELAHHRCISQHREELCWEQYSLLCCSDKLWAKQMGMGQVFLCVMSATELSQMAD